MTLTTPTDILESFILVFLLFIVIQYSHGFQYIFSHEDTICPNWCFKIYFCCSKILDEIINILSSRKASTFRTAETENSLETFNSLETTFELCYAKGRPIPHICHMHHVWCRCQNVQAGVKNFLK